MSMRPWILRVVTGTLPALAAVALLLSPAPLLAREYRVPILVDTEDDVLELSFAGDITEEEKELLLELLEDPLDPNTADRDELYDLPGLTWTQVDGIIAAREEARFKSKKDLGRVPGLTRDNLRQLGPFIKIVKEPRKTSKRRTASELRGTVQLKAVDAIKTGDNKYPETYLRVKAQGLAGMSVGALVTFNNLVSPVDYKTMEKGGLPADLWQVDENNHPLCMDFDPVTGQSIKIPCQNAYGVPSVPTDSPLQSYLLSDGEMWSPRWPKIYLTTAGDGWSVLAGSYQIGFGQRLVIDHTGSTNPHGFEPDVHVYDGLDGFTQSRGLMGLTGTAQLSLGNGMSLEATPFLSWWRYDIYQYRLVHRGEFEDETYAIVTELDAPYSGYYRKLSYQTLPAAFDELLGGANVTLNFGPRTHLGLTGYGSRVGFHLGDEDTGFSDSSGYPRRDVFAAFGMDGALALGRLVTLYGEAAMTDAQGKAGLVRASFDNRLVAADLSLRYLGDDFDNPHARAISMSDQWMGSQDRGELGVRLDASWRPMKALRLRLGEDVWRSTVRFKDNDPIDRLWRSETFFRVDTFPFSWLQVGPFVEYRDNDLETDGWGLEYSENGNRWMAGLQTTLDPMRMLRIWAYYKVSLFDDKNLGLADEEFQTDHYGVVKVRMLPFDWMIFSLRGKYYKGNLTQSDSVAREEYLEGYIQTDFRLPLDVSIGVRGAVVTYLAENASGVLKDNEYYWKTMLSYSF